MRVAAFADCRWRNAGRFGHRLDWLNIGINDWRAWLNRTALAFRVAFGLGGGPRNPTLSLANVFAHIMTIGHLLSAALGHVSAARTGEADEKNRRRRFDYLLPHVLSRSTTRARALAGSVRHPDGLVPWRAVLSTSKLGKGGSRRSEPDIYFTATERRVYNLKTIRARN